MNSDKTYDNHELIALLKQNDHQAFKYLYDKYAPALYSLILQIVNDKEIANKVTLEVFILIWRGIDNYNPAQERLFTWMLKIARTVAIEESKSHYYQHSNQLQTNKDVTAHMTGRSEYDNCGLKKLILELKEEQMVLIELCYFKDLNHDQIAMLLNIPSETIKKKIKSALSELRNLLT